ncbi:MAG: aminoglycoside phosphotransferase family protein [Defluviitaleaceae bacterium]|nr:aminoglycoside phosphotransferase family protein [Defluviitaleaceae bacterium]
MGNNIVKTTKLIDGWQSEICLIEAADGQCYVRKNYSEAVYISSPTIISEEWDALVFLHDRGYSVPTPVRKDANGIYMQYIENGALWEVYGKSDKTSKQELMQKYAKLLYDLHEIDVSSIPYNGRFVENELAEIRNIIEKHKLNDYFEILHKLESESANIAEQPLAFIHRDYHPWNVLVDTNDKLYAIDIFFTQGDYRFDVGWAYAHMKRTATDPEFVEFAENFLSEYLKLKPEANVDFEFFKQLANLRWLANVRPGEWSEKSDFWQHMIREAESAMSSYLGGT